MSISQNFPAISPTLNLNFARSKKLDPRITFTRTSSATRTNAQGLIEVVSANTPRFDHSYNSSTGSVNSLGLLIEESRSNLITYSEQFDNAGWSKTNAGITTNTSATTAPDGTNTAEKLVENTSSSAQHFQTQSITIVANTLYTATIFIKANTRSSIRFGFLNNTLSNGAYAHFNASTGVISSQTTAGTASSVSFSMDSFTSGWYRCRVSCIVDNSSTTSVVFIGIVDNSNNAVYTGDGTSGIYIWGAQVETGAFPTSYIPTSGSTVTRSADNASITGTNFSSFYNPSEGTVFVNYKGKSQEGTSYERIYSINLNSTNSVEEIFLVNNIGYNPDRIGYLVYDNSVVIQDTTGTTGGYVVASSSPVKTAMCYKTANYAYVFNGGTVITGNVAGVPTVNTLDIGRVGAGSQLNGTISQLLYYPVRLSNSQLQSLTK
jgi:hypothetical protein